MGRPVTVEMNGFAGARNWIFCDRLAQRLNDGIDHCRVEGVGGVQRTAYHLPRFEKLLKFKNFPIRPGYDTQVRSIVGSDLQRGRQDSLDRFRAAIHRDHGAAREVVHQSAAQGDDAESVFKFPDAS